MKTAKVDRILLGCLALGVWVLVATTLLKPESVIAEDQRSRDEIESINEDCALRGHTDGGSAWHGHTHNVDGHITC